MNPSQAVTILFPGPSFAPEVFWLKGKDILTQQSTTAKLSPTFLDSRFINGLVERIKPFGVWENWKRLK